MSEKLKKKLARQSKLTEKLMGNYSVGCRKASRVHYSRNAKWSYHRCDKVYYSHVEL